MWDWELVRRLLQQAEKVGEFYSPGMVATDYHRNLVDTAADSTPDLDDLLAEAEAATQALRAADCMRVGFLSDTESPSLGSSVLTPLGEELYQRLSSRRGVEVFQSMQADISRGEIERILHQLR
ncbi:hypothetical protein IB274_02475 [Pseudomonas sp. PDM18]|uniref:hypothetical protein n=1 Tax=Pseudomonas sp. PDM18 TaxID=2769253 RepID=UPI001785C92F|nr:hypothetical protein [Pseudomonas sp. PDM18]MBD9675544.1 hypothetical protein [Pseudomonas sp. PDM18]